ncbi:hypothetical protein LEP1GSC061_1897 [Leptospira wolffii serovar Khorat str. Khorat-H2]|nr:hypothetical protein LEP1GSC061_1897 [Leptospira wolffii serovar Khorat str. Khorat-H2]
MFRNRLILEKYTERVGKRKPNFPGRKRRTKIEKEKPLWEGPR